MKLNWLNVAAAILGAVQVVETTVKGKGQTKLEKASAIADATIMALNMGIGKEVLSEPTVVAAKLATINAIVAYENAVAETKANLSGEVPESESESHPEG